MKNKLEELGYKLNEFEHIDYDVYEKEINNVNKQVICINGNHVVDYYVLNLELVFKAESSIDTLKSCYLNLENDVKILKGFNEHVII